MQIKCPTRKQILKASTKSTTAYHALRELFPEVFDRVLQPGQVYSWGTDSDGGSGLVIEHPKYINAMSFINFHKGFVYINFIPKDTNSHGLNELLKALPPEKLHNCYKGDITGPKYFKSWSLT
jgi:hypothetical protein